MTNSTCAHAVNYLASYGILSGYSDGTFRPEAPISRAAFAASLHRCQFSPPVGRYGDTPDFPDVPSDFWAAAYIHSADTLDWMTGYPDGLFRPTGEVTRAQAVTAINRMLGRDESLVSTETCPNPFTDLDNDHWAYRNVLEATGTLIEMPEFVDKPLPEETTAYTSPTKPMVGPSATRNSAVPLTAENTGSPLASHFRLPYPIYSSSVTMRGFS